MILCIEALTWLALQKSSNTWKSVFCIANNILFHEKETSFMYLSFTLKIALSNFLSLRKNLFSICGLEFASALQITFNFMTKKHLSYLSFNLKIALSNFLSLRRGFSAYVALHSLQLFNCTKQSISVLRSSKLVILCLEALTWLALQKALIHGYLSSALQITFHFMRKKHFSCTWALLLKLH